MSLPKHLGEDVNLGGAQVFPTTGSAIVVDAGSQAPLMLPSGRFAADAEYLQQGDDLLLIAPDGTTVIVRDYFLTDSPLDLLTPEGGRVTPAIVKAFTPPEAVGQFAQVGATEAEAVGQISSAVGKVFVVRTNGVREAVGAGDPIFQGDVIETAEGVRSIYCLSTRRPSRSVAMRVLRSTSWSTIRIRTRVLRPTRSSRACSFFRAARSPRSTRST